MVVISEKARKIVAVFSSNESHSSGSTLIFMHLQLSQILMRTKAFYAVLAGGTPWKFSDRVQGCLFATKNFQSNLNLLLLLLLLVDRDKSRAKSGDRQIFFSDAAAYGTTSLFRMLNYRISRKTEELFSPQQWKRDEEIAIFSREKTCS